MTRSLNSLVEERVRTWQLAQDQRPSESRRAASEPLITVSREAYSGGTSLGRALAERLGHSFWDQELVHEIARLAQIPERLVASLDESRRSSIEEFVTALLDARATHDDYVAQLHRVVLTLVEHGGAVVVGRGAQFILRSQQCLRVRVVAPLAQRVANVMEREQLTRTRAEARIRELEETRQSFIRRTFGVDVTDPSHYDLMINLGTLTSDQAVNVLAAAYAAKFPGRASSETLRKAG